MSDKNIGRGRSRGGGQGFRGRPRGSQASAGQRAGSSADQGGASGGASSSGASYSGQSRDSSRGSQGGYRSQGATGDYHSRPRGAFRGGHGGGGHGGGGDRGGHGGGGDRGGHGGGGDRGGRGGFRGRGRGGRAESPVRNDVRKVAETVEILPEFKSKPKGTKGIEVELITNHYKIEESIEDLIVFHYDIDITLRRRDGKVAPKRPQRAGVGADKRVENRKIIDKMAVEWPEVPLSFNTYAYDGHKNLFTVEDLMIGSEQEVTREVTITLDGYPEQTYDVTVKFARYISMNDLNANEEFADARQVMDIVLRDRMQRSLVTVGRNLFKRDAKNTIQLVSERTEQALNCSIGFGHHQSILKTESGLNANIDRISTIFRGDAPLIDFIKKELEVESLANVRFNAGKIEFLTQSLRNLKIYTNHIKINGVEQKRKAGIESMTNIKPSQHSFENRTGVKVTVTQHFQTEYGVTLRFPELPLIKVKGGTRENPRYLPVEVCHVYPNQPLPKPLITRDIQRQIVESTNTQTPLKRAERNQSSLETISAESRALMESFGLTINPKPIKLRGRQIPAPKVIGDGRRLKETVKLERSLFINLSPKANGDLQGHFDNFFKHSQYGLINMARGMGFTVALPTIQKFETEAISSFEDRMNTFYNFIKSVKKGSVQMVFVCLPNELPLYEFVKYLSETVCGILTQGIKDNLFMRTKPGYFNNFLLKTNAKLNGQNQALASRQDEYRPRLLTDKEGNTMIIGADVTHPGYHNPLANERVISSIAAVVGSYDMDFTKFMATVSAQPANTEFITDFGEMFGNLLNGFNQINQKYPQNIILFRDGVSESQLDAVLNGEVPQIEAVYRKKNLPKPKIIVYVVQKRHHTRMFRSVPNVDRNGRENFNMNSGTVVDHTITNPDLNEFHLCSHRGLLGTSRHAKYVCLRNDFNFNQDQLQWLAFSMCFAYCRCTTPISIPIPVKYADLAAYRAKQHTAAQNTIFEVGGRDETEDDRRARERRNIRKLNETMVVHQNMKFIPYYC